jgi:hypothetical protein
MAPNRWLLCTFITRDLSHSAAHRPSIWRIVDADYSMAEDVQHRQTSPGASRLVNGGCGLPSGKRESVFVASSGLVRLIGILSL